MRFRVVGQGVGVSDVYAQPSTEQSLLVFERYCQSVEQGNG